MADRAQQILNNLIYEEVIRICTFERNKLNDDNFKDKPFEIRFGNIVNNDYFKTIYPNIPNSIHKNVDKVVVVKAKKNHVALFNMRNFPFIEEYDFDKNDGSLVIQTTLSKLYDFMLSQHKVVCKQLDCAPVTRTNSLDPNSSTKYIVEGVENQCNKNTKKICDLIIQELYTDFMYYNKFSILLPSIYYGNYSEVLGITDPSINILVANYDLENFFLVGIPSGDDIKYLPVLRDSFDNMIKSLGFKWYFSSDGSSIIIDCNMTNFRDRLISNLTGENSNHK